MDITSVGVDLAKAVFSVCAMDRSGRVVDRRDLKRDAFMQWLRRLPRGRTVGMEACSASHYWARTMGALGRLPRIMAAEFVLPHRKSRAMKNDRNDAEAVALAVRDRRGASWRSRRSSSRHGFRDTACARDGRRSAPR
jgi:transposase